MSEYKYLYRGVSEIYYREKKGKLEPKALYKDFSYLPQYSDKISDEKFISQYGNIQYGESISNEVYRHQFEQAGLPTSGISTSPFIERAKFYATHGNTYSSGFVYIIETELLSYYSISCYRVSDFVDFPSIPEDDEHILVSSDYVALPTGVITKIIHI